MDRTTVNVYETHVDDWIEHRRRDRPASIDAFVARVPPGVRADVGCGPGWHSAELGEPVVAFDAAPAMAAQVRTFAPEACPLVADLEHLPFRAGALTGAWAHRSYMHIAAEQLPMALAELHRAVALGGAVHLQVTSDRHQDTATSLPVAHVHRTRTTLSAATKSALSRLPLKTNVAGSMAVDGWSAVFRQSLRPSKKPLPPRPPKSWL